MYQKDTSFENPVKTQEIDIVKFAALIWKRKIFVLVTTSILCIVILVSVLVMENVYRSSALLRPTEDAQRSIGDLGGLGGLAAIAGINVGGNRKNIFVEMDSKLTDRSFLYNIIKKHNFEENFIENYKEVSQSPHFKENEAFLLHKYAITMIGLSQDKRSGLVTLSFDHTDRAFAQQFAKILLDELSEHIKADAIVNNDEKIEGYKREIEQNADVSLKAKLSELVATLVQNKVLASIDKYYGFTVVYEPTFPTKFDKVKPRRAFICIVGGILSIFFSVFLVLAIEYMKRLRERFRQEMDNHS